MFPMVYTEFITLHAFDGSWTVNERLCVLLVDQVLPNRLIASGKWLNLQNLPLGVRAGPSGPIRFSRKARPEDEKKGATLHVWTCQTVDFESTSLKLS